MSKNVFKGNKPIVPAKDTRPEPDPRQRQAITAAWDFLKAKPAPYQTTINQTAAGKPMSISAPHSDEVGYLAMRNRTFGTASTSFAHGCEGWLARMVQRKDADKPTESELNAAFAAVGSVEPQNEVEAMLAVQMVSTHETAMSMLSMAKHSKWVDQSDKLGNLAVKLLRTYTQQVEALAKLRRKGEQTVRVEHVHVYPGGQAIVGQVTPTPGGGGGTFENGHQAHAPELKSRKSALTAAVSPPVLCADAVRDGVPVTGGEGEEKVPYARRRPRQRRANG